MLSYKLGYNVRKWYLSALIDPAAQHYSSLVLAMPSQEAFQGGQNYDFYDDDGQGGQLMTRNTPSTQAQRQVTTNRGKKSPFKADVRLVTCVHGKMSEDDSTAASLLVFEYHLGCTGGKHRYTSLTTKLAFRSESPQLLIDEPFVKTYAPFKLSEMMDPVEVEYSKKRTIEGNLGATFTPANAGLTLSGESEKKYRRDSCLLGQAFPEFTDGKSGSDAVLWELKENTIKEIGVPDTFRVAVLIQRATSNKFLCDFTLELHAGIWFAARGHFRKVCGLIDEDDPIIFDPSLGPQGETVGLTSSRLSEFIDDKRLQDLTPIHYL